MTQTRLIRASSDLLGLFGTRTKDGRRLTAEWGEPIGHCPDSDEYIYEPVFTAHGASWAAPLDERYRALVEAARYQHENGDLHSAEHSPPYEYCCSVGSVLAALETSDD